MAAKKSIVSHIYIKIAGNDLPAGVRSQLLEVSVDQHVHLPAMFTLRFYDAGLKLLDSELFQLTKSVAISGQSASGAIVPLIEGEITAIEPDFGKGMIAELTIRGYDKSHRLYRERKSKTYLNVKDSDLATQIAKKAQLTPEVDVTTTVYEHIYQHNLSDLSFLQHRAWRIGYECYVAEGKLYFRKPTASKPLATVIWGQDLITFRPHMSLAEQVNEVHVQGWDVQKKSAIIGRAQDGKLYPQTTEIKDKKRDGKAWSQELNCPARMVIVDQPVVSQAEADILAAARLDELSGAYLEAEGESFRRPDIQAGRLLQIDGLGKRLSGEYLVTRATHRYTDEGLKTFFSVNGLRTGLLAEQLNGTATKQSWQGIVPAIVTNTDDPNNWGRVKVKFPWLSEQDESAWARVIGIGAGNGVGLGIIPAVNDEVMVAFQHGDFNTPIVIGGMWNGADALPPAVHGATGAKKPDVHSWVSRGGHQITLDDTEKTIVVQSSTGLQLIMDDNAKKITIKSNGEVEVVAAKNLNLQGANVTVKASNSLALEGTIAVTVKGGVISLN